jgi:hypothetical protein
MKLNSIKLIILVAKKIMLQKKIIKYNDMIKDIDELIDDDINFKSNMDDFEILFKKLVSDFGECLDEDENKMQEDKIEIDLKKS